MATAREYAILRLFGVQSGVTVAGSSGVSVLRNLSLARLYAGSAWLVFGPALALAATRPRAGKGLRGGPGLSAIALSAGLAACWAVAKLFDVWLGPLIPPPPGWSRDINPGLVLIPMVASLRPHLAWAIASAWTLLALLGEWRRPDDWVERAGRWLGWGWLILWASELPLRLASLRLG